MQKICFAASSGGHLDEISNLRQLTSGRDCFLITERSEFSSSNLCERVYYVNQINRRGALFPFRFARLFIQSLRIIMSEKPDCVITTGALAAYPVSILAKLMKKKLIYIESFARTDSASLTGKLLHKHADLFIVQWEESAEFYPKAVYGGSIY